MPVTIPPVNSAPLGFFDSGVGGLTVVRAVQELLPAEDILYLGDTARLPYGSKSPETIRQFADEDVRFLIARGVKAIVVACNTATAHALPSLHEKYRIPILGVIEPGVEAALANPDAERIGIIATRGTIQSHAYQHALALRRTGLIIHGQAAPLLVPLVEENWIDHPATRHGSEDLSRSAGRERHRYPDARLHPLPAADSGVAGIAAAGCAPGGFRDHLRRAFADRN